MRAFPGIVVVVAIAAATVGHVTAQSRTVVPVVGAYKLNVEKSKYSIGQPPQSLTRSVEDRGARTYIYRAEGVNAQGVPTYNAWTFKYDGLDYPTGYNAMTREKATVAYRVIDAYTVEVIQKVNGKPGTVKNVRSMSKDLKTMTYMQTGTNAQGQTVNDVLVFEKQAAAISTR